MIGLRHSATATAVVTKEQVCEHCGSRFYYQMRCKGEGTSFDPYFLGAKYGHEDAAAEAKYDLAQKSKSQFEPVPCPSCFNYQSKMVRQLKLSHFRWLVATGWAFIVAGFWGFLAEPGTGGLGPLTSLALGMGIACLAIRWIKVILYQPNKESLETRKAIATSRAKIQLA